MNKIFKVIWSKSKQCYVVVSEMAKNKTGKKKIVVASILAALAMQVGVVADVTAADRPTGTIEGGTKMYSNLTNGLAIGNESQSNSNQSIAIGYRAIANSQYADPAQPAVAIGAGAHATGRGGVSLGLIANSSVRGTAIGSATQATGFGAFAGGTYAQATNAGDVAIGGASSDQFNNYAVASGGYSVAIGTAAKADGGAGVSIGYKTNAKTSNSLAVGSESQATGEGAVAVGRKNTSTGASSTVLGILSTASATSATAVGMQTTATGENSLAVGHLSSAIGKNGVAVGTNRTTAALGGVAVGQAAKANKFNSVAMGMNVTADGDNSVALGGSASANSDGTIAIGSYGSTPTKATGNRALAIGSATTANGLESIAIGSRVNSTSQHSIAIGTRANASAVKSVAIGPDSIATVDGGVALGRDSVANVIGGVTNKGYNPNTNRTDIYSSLTGNVLTSTTGAVSIGNGTTVTRQLTGLAAGTKDTDAVNVAQLKSVNLAFSGNVNTGNVNIANSTLGIKGDNTYITTAANGQNLTISGKTQNINVTNGQASANAAGMADSKNVADAINKAISANAYHWKLAAENTSTAPEVINKSDTVIFGGDNNITVTRSGKKITTSLNKAITVDTVKANRSVTVSSGGNQITLDGSNGAVTGRSFTGDSFKAGNNVLSNTTLQMGLPSSAKNVTISGDGLTAKNGTRTVKFGTDGISAGGQQITNVSSGGNVGTNAANITDVKNAVDAVTLKLDTNSKTGTVKLSESPLKVIGANGIRTDLLGTNNGSLVVGLDKTTVNATTKGIGLTGDTGSTGLKYLKDGDATFRVAGDGDLVTTKASTTGVQISVDPAKVKDLAVGAVTVSKANTADNPITVTPTAGTNSKDYAIGIDTTKLANQTQLTYKANGANANKVSLANGLNFTDGTFTKATVGTNGTVTISTATETITNDADGKAKVNSPTDGLATAKNVADSINKAVDGLSQNLTVSDGATDGTVNLKNQKLTVSGTNGVSTTVNGQTVTVGLDAATKTKVDNASTAVARNISLGADSGTASSQSLKDGDVAFNVKGATGDLVSTKMNGNTVEISTKRAAITSDANTGAASVTGDDGLATSKNVADAINKAADAAKAGAAWNLTTNSSTTDKTTVQGGDTVDLINGDNILITQDGTDKKKITVATKKDLTVDSITAGNTVINTSGLTNGTTAITGTGITTDKVTVGGISIDKTDGINGGNKTITNVASGGTTDSNAANIGDVKQAVANLSQNLNITDGTNNGTIDLKNQKLNVAGTNGVTATVNGQTVTVGLDADTKTKVDNSSVAVARNISLGADSGTASSQSLKDGDVAFNVKGATGDFISTKMNGDTVEVSTKRSTINSDATGTASVTGDDGLATAKNVADAINKAASQAKDGAAWKLSTNGDTPTTVAGGDTVDFTGDNNITVTQTGKNIATTLNKDLKKLNSISLENGVGETIKFDAINASGKFGDPAVGNYTQIDRDGIRINNGIDVNQPNTANTYLDVGTLSLQAGPNSSSLDSKNLMFNDEDGNFAQGSAQGMAFRNAAGKEVQFTLDEINAGGNKIKEVAEGTDDTDAVNVKQLKDTVASQTLTYRANTAADTDAKSVKLSKGLDFVDGTMTKATVDNDGKVTFDINDDTKTKINDAAAAVSRKVSLGADSGTTSSQSLKDGDVAFNVKGATGDFISTKMNGDTVEVSTKRVTIDSNATTGAASVTGDDGLATAKNVADAINKAAKASTDAINLKFAGDTNTSAGVVNLKDDTLGIKGDGKYVTTDADGKNLTVKVSEAEVKKSAVAAVTVSTDTTDANNPISVTPTTSADGTTKDYKVTIDGTKIANKTNLSYKANDSTAKQVSLADGLNFKNGTLTTASIDDAGVVKYDVNTATITAGTDGTVTGPTTDGVATAQNVADAINAAKKASKTEITANTGEAANATTGNVTLTSTTAADGHTIYDVKLNDKVTLGTGANAVTIDGTAGKATIGSAVVDGVNNTITTGGANAVTLDGATAKVTAGVTTVDGVTGTITTGGTNSIKVDGATGTVTGLTNKDWTPGVTKAVTGRAATEDQLQKVADAASSQTWNITADKAGTTGAQTGTKKNATVGKDQTVELVAGDNLTINQDERKFTYSLNKDLAGLTSVSVGDGTTETIKLDGATGKITAKNAAIGGVTIDGDNKHVTGLSNTTWNGTATTGRAATEDQLKAVADTAKATTDAVNLKFSGDTNTSAGVVNLKDDTFNIVGDGKYVSTDANGKDLTVKVSEAEVKKSAVSAVTVSTDTTDADNPLTVTGTPSADGTTKDYKVTIDGTKVATKTKLSYKANDGSAKQVSLADGLNFKDGTLTTATIDDAGVVKYDVKTAAITAGTDGTITGPATDGVATAKNVADAINAAKKASKTEITANDDEAANATTGNVKLTSTTAADGHTIYNVKLNDTLTFGTGANAIVIDGTAGKATIGSAAIDGVNNTITTGGNKAVTLDGTTGTITGKAANIGGVTVDGTNNHVTGLANTTWDGNAVSGRAATEDQLKVVADAAANQTWQITADKDAATSGKQTGTKSDAKVGKDAKVTMIAGENITINQNERDFTYSLNKDLVNMNSASFNGTGNNTTVINGDSITQTAGTQTNTSTAAGNTVADGTKSTATTADGTKITDGTKTNTSTADSTVIDDGNGNNTALTKDGVTITTSGKDPVSLTKDGLNNGGNKISNIADGTDDTDAVNVRQLEAKSKASKTELTANGGESAGSTTGNIVLTKTTAADGHIIYDNKLNDKVTLGTDPTKAVTVDGTTGTIKAGDGANAVAIDGKNGSVKAGDKIALDGKDGKATIGTVGIDGKDGIITTGGNNPVAVNGKDGVVTGLTNKTWDPNNIASGRAATEDQVKSAVENAGWNATIGTEGSGINSTPTATAEKVKTDETVTFKAGNNMMVSQAGKTISYAVNPELKDMKSATFKDAAGNTTVTDGNGITITPGSANPNNPNAGTISLTKDGLNNGNNQLKGIAPGTDDTDAVNVSQLKASNARIGDAIGQVAGEVQRVGAHAAAMAALKPIQYDPLEPTQVMAGVGNYRGETAAALGLAHYTNEDTMFNVGVSLGANRNMVNAGVTHKFGSSPEKKNIPDRYKAGPISSVYVMQDEVSSLKKENSEQKTVIADQAARLNTLEAENERQRQELAETKQGLEDLRAAVSQLLSSKG